MADVRVQVGLEQEGLRGRSALIYDTSGLIVDDYLVPAEFSDGTAAYHGQEVVIADDTPNVYGALAVHRPGKQGDTLMLHHTQLTVRRDKP
jgi:hypothetical protein